MHLFSGCIANAKHVISIAEWSFLTQYNVLPDFEWVWHVAVIAKYASDQKKKCLMLNYCTMRCHSKGRNQEKCMDIKKATTMCSVRHQSSSWNYHTHTWCKSDISYNAKARGIFSHPLCINEILFLAQLKERKKKAHQAQPSENNAIWTINSIELEIISWLLW